MDNVKVVRSLYGDIAPDENGDHLFDEDTINAWLHLSRDNVYAAAAMACRALAVDQAYLLKVVRTDDLQVNGAVVAAELRMLAEDLDSQARDFDAGSADAFEVIEWLQ